MIGKRVMFGYGTAENRVEGFGEVVDKILTSEPLYDEGKVVGISQHNIYLIKVDDEAKLEKIHPFNLIKIIE